MAEVKEERAKAQFTSTMDPCDMDAWIRRRFEIPGTSEYVVTLEGPESAFGKGASEGRVEDFRLGVMRMTVSWEE